MKTGFRGTFVISWAQTELDGQKSAPVADLGAGHAWLWTGEAVRVDGPRGILPLGSAEGETELRQRAALSVRRLLMSAHIDPGVQERSVLQGPLFDRHFTVTNGYAVWTVTCISAGPGRKPLLMFVGEIPPRGTELWVVSHNIDAATRLESQQKPGGVICFTPGTMILTPEGPQDVAALAEGDLVQTQDNGPARILWVGTRQVTGARLQAMPDLVPIRLRAGALDKGVPDSGLLVSPDHRVVLRGPRARALFNADEVLVAARDLINDATVIRDHAVRGVKYIHMMLEQHQIVFANGVATESFHPASAALATMSTPDRARIFSCMPDLRRDPHAYGPFARRPLNQSEAAVLGYDMARH
jgi:hypothetical protein